MLYVCYGWESWFRCIKVWVVVICVLRFGELYKCVRVCVLLPALVISDYIHWALLALQAGRRHPECLELSKLQLKSRWKMALIQRVFFESSFWRIGKQQGAVGSSSTGQYGGSS